MAVDEAADGPEALELLGARAYDAVVLDLVLPSISGVTLLRQIREHSDVAVVIVSACDDSAFSVISLEAGADDYCTKPMSERELVLRVERAIAHRRSMAGSTDAAGPSVIVHGPLTLDPVARIALLDSSEIELTCKEFDLLVAFVSAPGQVFSRVELLDSVWQTKPEWQSIDTVTEHVYRLRQKLAAVPWNSGSGEWIQTVRGAGYRFVVDQSVSTPMPIARTPLQSRM